MNSLLENIAVIISSNTWLAPLLAILAGALTSLTPCSLSTLPLVIGYVGGTGVDSKKAFKYSLIFAVGMAITFTVLGTMASIAGRLIGNTYSYWYLILGALMVLMALQIWELFNFIPSTYLISKNTKRGYAGALIAGILGGIFSSPCATPVLVALLAIVASSDNILWGAMLLLMYSVGHGILVVVAGTSIGIVRSLKGSTKYKLINGISKYILGGIVLVIGLYMFWLGF